MSGIDHLGIDLRVRFGAEVKQLRFPFRHPVRAHPSGALRTPGAHMMLWRFRTECTGSYYPECTACSCVCCNEYSTDIAVLLLLLYCMGEQATNERSAERLLDELLRPRKRIVNPKGIGRKTASGVMGNRRKGSIQRRSTR